MLKEEKINGKSTHYIRFIGKPKMQYFENIKHCMHGNKKGATKNWREWLQLLGSAILCNYELPLLGRLISHFFKIRIII